MSIKIRHSRIMRVKVSRQQLLLMMMTVLVEEQRETFRDELENQITFTACNIIQWRGLSIISLVFF